MLTERLGAYLTSRGLDVRDVPKIFFAWEFTKYTTKSVLILASIRYQPLSRLFRRAYQPFRNRMRARLGRELERTKDRSDVYARRLREWQVREDQLRKWREAVRANFQTRLELQRRRAQGLRASLRRRLERRGAKGSSDSVYEKVAKWYREQTAKRSEQVSQSRLFSSAAQLLALEPGKLAVGIAEGIVLGLVLAPVYYPLEFFLIVRYFQTPSVSLARELESFQELAAEMRAAQSEEEEAASQTE